MARDFTLPQKQSSDRHRLWHGMAFITETLILLAVLVFSLAILTQFFATVQVHSENASTLSASVILASNEAERFSANPAIDTEHYFLEKNNMLVQVEDKQAAAYRVSRRVEQEKTGGGTLYYASISVERYGSLIYSSDSARYVSDAEVM